MSRPFTIAKAISIEAPSAGRVIAGEIDRSRDAVWINGEPVAIAPYSICLNTGLTDANGEEIFEGDYLKPAFNDTDQPALVYFDEKRGAFYTSRVETSVEVYQNGDDEIRYCEYPNATVIKRLSGTRAKNAVVVENLLDAIAIPDNPSDDPVESDTVESDTVEVDFEPEDITRVDPDAGDDLTVDWAQRIDEAPGEY